MQTGAITGYIDVAQLTLYAFWFFFAGLIIYLRREDRREGYPLEADRPGIYQQKNFPRATPSKVFLMHDGQKLVARTGERPVPARAIGGFSGAPLEPTGNPLLDGIGPAAYADRADEPDLGFDDLKPKIVPLRVATDFFLATEDTDVRGLPVIGADNIVAGKITDVWVDRSEVVIRFLEAEITIGAAPRQVLIPMNLLQISAGKANHLRIKVSALLARQLADVPRLKNPDQITLLEEDRIYAYFGGGHMYAEPSRLGPIL